MAWTWTGYDHDAVHRFKESDFFLTGRNKAEDRFWKLQIHGANDRRGTNSSISLGAGSEGYGSYGHTDETGRHVHTYSEPRERSNSVISTFSSRMKQFGPTRDYPYSYPGEVSEEDSEDTEEEEEVVKKEPEAEEDKSEAVKQTKVEDDKEEETESKGCSCNYGKESSPVPEVKEIEKSVEKMTLKESAKDESKAVKSSPMKTMIETKKFVLDDHISSRFY